MACLSYPWVCVSRPVVGAAGAFSTSRPHSARNAHAPDRYPSSMVQQLGSFEKVLRVGEGRRLKRLAQQAAYIGTLEPEYEALSDEELAAKTVEFRERFANGETLDELLFEAFAAIRESFKRTMGVRLFDVQLMGGIVLHEGDIAEMKTGEGKTFVATQALYLNAIAGNGTHLVTTNDYLAQRDREWTRPVFEALGMRTAYIENMMPFEPRREAYQSDVTYGTNSEFGFDYLRDNMAVAARGDRPARPPLRHRGRGRLHPDRRGAHAADHLRRAGDRRAALLRLRAHRPDADRVRVASRRSEGRGGGRGRGLRVRREAQDRRRDRAGRREGRARAADGEPVRPAQRAGGQPSRAVAEGAVALPPRRRLRHPGRRGEDRRRVHRPDHGGPPLERGPAPGGRGEGGRPHPGGAPDARDHHAPELLPPVREARRHDRHGEDGGEGVRRDLQPQRRRDPDQRPGRARRRAGSRVQDEGRQVQRRRARHQGAQRQGTAGARRHDRRRDLGVPLAAADAPGRQAQRAEREGARARGGDHHRRGAARLGHDRDEHGRPRRRHQARRGRRRARRPVRRRHRAARVAPDRQPAPRPLRPPGRPRRDALLPLRRGRPRPAVRRRPDQGDHGALQDPGRPADGGEDPQPADRGRAEEGRGAELRHAQERPQVRRRAQPAPRTDLRAAPRRARGPGHVGAGRSVDRRGGRGHRAPVHRRRSTRRSGTSGR